MVERRAENALSLTSAALKPGATVPRKHTGDGVDVSPPLAWSGVPESAAELALICDDPDAPTPEPWVHWVIYKIPRDAGGLKEAIPRQPTLSDPPGALQGKNTWPTNNVGYRGPAPPAGHGVHHYRFHLYALSSKLDLKPGLSKRELLKAMAGHVISEAELVGTYQR